MDIPHRFRSMIKRFGVEWEDYSVCLVCHLGTEVHKGKKIIFLFFKKHNNPRINDFILHKFTFS